MWNNIQIINPLTGEFDANNFQMELNNRLRYYFSHIDIGSISIGSTGSLTLYAITVTTANTAYLSSTGSATLNIFASSSGRIGQLGSTGSITANTLTASSANIAQLGSTGSITANTLTASSANIGQLGSTGSATFNTLASSSAIIGQLGSTGNITANTLTASSANFTKVQASSAKFGNSTSYSMFEDDGTYVAIDGATVVLDELGDILKLKIVGVGISEDSTDGTVNFDATANLSDFIFTNVQFNHNRLLTATLKPHIHVIQNSSIIPNMLLGYRYQYNGNEISTGWTYITINTPVFTHTVGTTLHQIFRTTAGITPSSSLANISDIIQFKIYRDNTNASTMFSSTDNLATSLRTLSFDVHYEVDTLGSRTEYSK